VHDLPFDKITIRDGEVLGVEEFLRLPLSERIALVLERKLSFTLAGKPVDRNLALRRLMESAKRS
jgi:hypothetical protein